MFSEYIPALIQYSVHCGDPLTGLKDWHTCMDSCSCQTFQSLSVHQVWLAWQSWGSMACTQSTPMMHSGRLWQIYSTLGCITWMSLMMRYCVPLVLENCCVILKWRLLCKNSYSYAQMSHDDSLCLSDVLCTNTNIVKFERFTFSQGVSTVNTTMYALTKKLRDGEASVWQYGLLPCALWYR